MLTEAAVFERVSAPLLAEVPDRTYAGGDLSQLAERNVPIEPIDSDMEWYRFYQPYQSLLRQRLRRLDPSRWQQLNRYAADWFERHGFPVEAVRHAAECADPAMTAGVMVAIIAWICRWVSIERGALRP